METAGDRIRRRRLELGLSQREIASKGASYAYISRIESNEREPSIKALRKLAPKLGVSVHWLETGRPSPAEELALPRRASTLARALLRDASAERD